VGVKPPKFQWNVGPTSRTSQRVWQKNLVTSELYSIDYAIFLQSATTWVHLRSSTTCPNKSKMADDGHIEFRKMLISPYDIKIFLFKKWYEDATRSTTRRCPRDQNSNPKLIRMTSSVECREQVWVVLHDTSYFNEIWYTAHKTDNRHSGTCQIHLSWKSNMTAAAILNLENV